MQRRDGLDICHVIGNVIWKGTEHAANASIMTLVSIGTVNSQTVLYGLREKPPPRQLLDLVKQQLQNQYRLSEHH